MSNVVIETNNKISGKARRLASEIWANRISYGFVAPFMIVFLTFTVAPVLVSIFLSFTQFNILEAPKFIGFDNYKNLLLSDTIFPIAIKNTFIFAAITGPLSYLACMMLAWFINDLSPKVRAILTLLFYTPTLANIFFVWQLIFSPDSYGFLNAYLIKLNIILEPIQWLTDVNYMVPVVIIIILWASLGTSFLIFIAGFQTVDKSLYESGAVDGVKNRWQELWYITLPYLKPQLLLTAVLSIAGSFSIGGTISALVGFPSTNYVAHTLMHMLEDYGGMRFEMGYACAIATILFVIMVGTNKIIQNLISKVGD
ncbi:MAG: carbohydrate ABC transporter permease [Saccharofermentanales bacterium]